MRIFIYEHITGGGLFESEDRLLAPLRIEGAQMLSAIATDFAAVDGVHVSILRDTHSDATPSCVRDGPRKATNIVEWGVRTSSEVKSFFDRFVQESDWTLLIAPETNGILADLARRVDAIGGRLLSPGIDFVALTSNKLDTARRLAAAGLPVPESRLIEVHAGVADARLDFPYPAVIKPVDGAASMGMRRLAEPSRLMLNGHASWMIEPVCPGTSASVALLCGPDACLPLPPFQQQLESETFQYLGGARIMDAGCAGRATDLALRAIEALGRPTGYVGVDLVLGDNPTGTDDTVIEVNPRLTTSYIGLRAFSNGNLAEAMLSIATGQPAPLSFRDDALEFAVADAFPSTF